MHPMLDRLRRRKLVQWGTGYAVVSWIFYQVFDALSGAWGVSDVVLRLTQVALASGFCVALTLAWFHGERGHQRVTALESLVIAAVLACGAIVGRRLMNVDLPRPGGGGATLMLSLPSGQSFVAPARAGLALAPDGDAFVYVGPAANAGSQLWLRPIGEMNAVPIEGTEGGYNPFFAPDGKRLGFSTGISTLKTVSLAGGLPLTIVDTVVGSAGGTWGNNGWIYVDGNGATGLFRVSETGGDPEPLTKLDVRRGETNHTWPDALPGGRGVLFTVARRSTDPLEIAVLDLVSGKHRILGDGVYARYSATGHIAIVSADDQLVIAPFDEAKLTVTGERRVVRQGLARRLGGAADLTIAHDGTTMYSLSGRGLASELVLVDRTGREDVILREVGSLSYPALSPDERTIAVGVSTPGGRGEIWLVEVEGGRRTQFTFSGGAEPSWSSDGSQIAFAADRIPLNDLFIKPSDGSKRARLMRNGTGFMTSAVLDQGGKRVVYWESGSIRTSSVSEADKASVELRRLDDASLVDAWSRGRVALSTDDKWLAFVDARGGDPFVMVSPYPEAESALWMVGAGNAPTWSRDGRLFYRSAADSLVEVRATARSAFEITGTTNLIDVRAFDAPFDVSADGRRFVLVRPLEGAVPLLVYDQNLFGPQAADRGR